VRVDGRRLAGAVRAEHGKQLAAADSQVDIRDRFNGAESLGRVAELGHHRSALGSGNPLVRVHASMLLPGGSHR
jgi:hypothetical protein